MNPALISLALQLLTSGKLDGLLSGLPDLLKGLGSGEAGKNLTDLLSGGSQDPVQDIMAALGVLAKYVPSSEKKADDYLEGVAALIAAFAKVREAVGGASVNP